MPEQTSEDNIKKKILFGKLSAMGEGLGYRCFGRDASTYAANYSDDKA